VVVRDLASSRTARHADRRAPVQKVRGPEHGLTLGERGVPRRKAFAFDQTFDEWFVAGLVLLMRDRPLAGSTWIPTTLGEAKGSLWEPG
jgi:hypothetical protein